MELDTILRNGYGDVNSSSFDKLVAATETGGSSRITLDKQLVEGRTIRGIITCMGGAGSVKVTVTRGNERLLSFWTDTCSPPGPQADIAYGGATSTPVKKGPGDIVMTVDAPKVRHFAVVLEQLLNGTL